MPGPWTTNTIIIWPPGNEIFSIRNTRRQILITIIIYITKTQVRAKIFVSSIDGVPSPGSANAIIVFIPTHSIVDSTGHIQVTIPIHINYINTLRPEWVAYQMLYRRGSGLFSQDYFTQCAVVYIGGIVELIAKPGDGSFYTGTDRPINLRNCIAGSIRSRQD